MLKRIELKIYGRVQGVFFRRQAEKKATSLGLAGFARNEPDGTVYAVAEGEEEKLKEFAAWCGKGPELAEVAKVEEDWTEPEGKFRGFGVQ